MDGAHEIADGISWFLMFPKAGDMGTRTMDGISPRSPKARDRGHPTGGERAEAVQEGEGTRKGNGACYLRYRSNSTLSYLVLVS